MSTSVTNELSRPWKNTAPKLWSVKNKEFIWCNQVGPMSTTFSCSGVGGRGAGGAIAHPEFWSVENLGKIPENLGKNGAQRCLTSKNGAQRLQKNTIKTFFGGHTKSKNSCSLWEKVCGQKAQKNFSGKFGEIRAKILRTSKNLPAPTPMFSCIGDMTKAAINRSSSELILEC